MSNTHLLTHNAESQINVLPYSISVSKIEHSQTVYLSGEIDYAASLSLKPILDQVVQNSSGNLFFDLGKVEFIDSEGVKLLIDTFAQAQQCGANVKIIRYSDRVLRTFELAGIYEILHTCCYLQTIS